MYRNPVLDADWPDLDVAATDEGFVLVASSFTRTPGLPLLRSTNLVEWENVGHALERNVPVERFRVTHPGQGVWAPSIRVHDGLLRIYWGDPDEGIWTVSAAQAAGPWSEPHLVIAGQGLIDPCPLWDEDGRVWLAHGWAKSRSGIDNRIDIVELDAEGLNPVGTSQVLIDGADVPGCSVLEGPKLYQARGWYWLYAPAGGVATGWQYVFRATSLDGPWEHRVTLAQHETSVNGPHQGAWVTTPEGEDWFLHFQDRGWAGRVVHLQPMTWDADGWPVMGDAGAPVTENAVPKGLALDGRTAPRVADDWREGIGRQWAWQANPPAPNAWGYADDGVLFLPAATDDTDPRALGSALSLPLPGAGGTLRVSVALDGGLGASGGIAVLGAHALTCVVENTLDGPRALATSWREDASEAVGSVSLPGTEVTFELAWDRQGLCESAVIVGEERHPLASEWQATPGVWVGASFALISTRGNDASILHVGKLEFSATAPNELMTAGLDHALRTPQEEPH